MGKESSPYFQVSIIFIFLSVRLALGRAHTHEPTFTRIRAPVDSETAIVVDGSKGKRGEWRQGAFQHESQSFYHASGPVLSDWFTFDYSIKEAESTAFEEERLKEPNPGLAVSGKSCLKWVFEALFRRVLLIIRVVYMICSKLEIFNGI